MVGSRLLIDYSDALLEGGEERGEGRSKNTRNFSKIH